MNMCRIVLADGSLMHIEPGKIVVDGGHLQITRHGDNALLAIFAPGVWRYWLHVEMASA